MPSMPSPEDGRRYASVPSEGPGRPGRCESSVSFRPALGRVQPAMVSKSPSLTPARKARTSSPVYTRAGPSGNLELRTATSPPGSSAISTQFPLGLLWWLFLHSTPERELAGTPLSKCCMRSIPSRRAGHVLVRHRGPRRVNRCPWLTPLGAIPDAIALHARTARILVVVRTSRHHEPAFSGG